MRIALLLLFFCACGGDDNPAGGGVCDGVDCVHGRCVEDGPSAACDCDEGYVAIRLSCLGEDSLPEPLLQSGSVLLDSRTDAEGVWAAAFFVRYDPDVDGFSTEGRRATCGGVAYGSCDVVHCEYRDDPGLVFDPAVYESAGDITLRYGATEIPLAFATDYMIQDAPYAPYAAGESVEARAAGDVVPGFILSATAPATVTIAEPTTDLRAGDALTFEWTGGADGNLLWELQWSEGDEGLAVRCSFPASDGEGTIAGEVTSLLPRGPVDIGLRLESKSDADLDDWHVELVVAGNEMPTSNPFWTFDVHD